MKPVEHDELEKPTKQGSLLMFVFTIQDHCFLFTIYHLPFTIPIHATRHLSRLI
jgi:hypothetical protein